jgi:hypothetical protein
MQRVLTLPKKSDLSFPQNSYEEIPFMNLIYTGTKISNCLFYEICIYQLWLSRGNSNLQKCSTLQALTVGGGCP